MNILAVVAHPDDEILGCGATLRKLADAGHSVSSCVLCSTVAERSGRPPLDRLKKVARKASQIVGIEDTLEFEFENIRFNVIPHIEIVRAIEQAILKFKPAWIFTHHPGDINIDHRVTYEATMSAAMLPQRLSSDLPPTMIQKILLFEVLSSTDWAPPVGEGFRPNSFFDVRATFETKLTALDSFEGAMKPDPHSRSRENVRRLAQMRGAQMGIELAEAFCLVRDLNN